jgi:predicted MFS family arabinose efflux permease
VRSRVVGASEAMIDIALSIGFVLGGPAVAALGPRVVYAIGGACGLLGAVVLVPVLRASMRAAAVAGRDSVQEHVEADERVVTRFAV